ncbi:MAG: LysM peptidoglycan-binding domain-containing protein [Rhodobacteraceae bacterium]|nr:LysM peptidoglycan-binding domain-containing protein [Paracoccaceae bacterium]
MTKIGLIWTTGAAAVVGISALVVAYFFPALVSDNTDPEPAVVSAPADENAADVVSEDAASETADAADTTTILPTFDVVGVEPTGDAVIAGRSKPGAVVELVANGAVVGKGTANKDGEWAIVLEEPFAPGEYDVAVRVNGADGSGAVESEQRLAISVPNDSMGKPLVVLNSPDGPSNILQKPATAVETEVAAAEDTAEETVVAAADETLDDAADTMAEVASNVEDAVEETGEDATAAMDQAVSDTETEVAAAETEAAAVETEVAAAVEATTETVADAGSAAAEKVEETADAVVDAAKDMASETADVDMKSDADDTDEVVAVVETPVEEAKVEEASFEPVKVEAVESEKGTVYVAGTGNPGDKVQVYLGGELLGTVDVTENGSWLFEGDKDIAPGSVEVRADMVDASGEVRSRAAVAFDKVPEAIILTKAVASAKTDDAAAGMDAEVEVNKPLPNVIIRKGDNLWTIARRLYGDGFRYTTIYQANKGQIRNPDLIYPGQIFLTPDGAIRLSEPQNKPAN